MTHESHYPALWDILKGWGSFWADKDHVKTLDHFRTWYTATAKDSLTGMDSGQVIGAAYLDYIRPGHFAQVNIFKRRGYLNPRMISRISRDALPYWFKKYDLELLLGITRQKSAIKLAKRIGFKKTGTFPKWKKVNGEWNTYTVLTFLKEQLK